MLILYQAVNGVSLVIITAVCSSTGLLYYIINSPDKYLPIRFVISQFEMAFRGIFDSFVSFPKVRADSEEEEAELVDPQTVLREKCQTHGNIEALYQKYQECNDRVNSRSKTTETCMEELFDYVAELDHCVAHSLWPKLK